MEKSAWFIEDTIWNIVGLLDLFLQKKNIKDAIYKSVNSILYK